MKIYYGGKYCWVTVRTGPRCFTVSHITSQACDKLQERTLGQTFYRNIKNLAKQHKLSYRKGHCSVYSLAT